MGSERQKVTQIIRSFADRGIINTHKIRPKRFARFDENGKVKEFYYPQVNLFLDEICESFPHLEKLNISNLNSITTLPSSLYQLENLKILRGRKIGLKKISKKIENNSSLEIIDLPGNNLSSIPKEIGYLNLQILNLSNNNISNLPSSIRNLSYSLQVIGLDNNSFENFPLVLTKLENLRTLGLDYNHLRVIPPEIKRLQRLNQFGCIQEFPLEQTIPLVDLSSLTWLSFSPEIIPVDLHQLSNLRFLIIVGTRNTELPQGICQLENLQYLRVTESRLRTLPECIYQLSRLKQIRLPNNIIRKLSPSIGAMQSLEIFDLSNNDIENLPPTINRLKEVEIILDGNPLQTN